MNHKRLGELDEQLHEAFDDYLSMLAVGSIAVGDPWIEGRSDMDILLIFKPDSTIKFPQIEQILGEFDFDDTYEFTAMPRDHFGQANSKYAFSNRYRTKTLFGPDFVPESELPDDESISDIWAHGLSDDIHRLKKYVANSVFWGVSRIRKKLWKQFKHTFMHLAIRAYGLSGDYPCTRREIVDRSQSPELAEVYEVLHSIDHQEKERIVNSARGLVSFLEDLD